MVDPTTAGPPPAASPAADQAVREIEVLSGLTQLALEMARTFQAQGLAALAAGDLKRAGKAETRFSSLFLAIRRVIALRARLRRQRQGAWPAADEAAMLSELMELAAELAQGFQAQGLDALAAGDLDRAGEMETRFSSLFLGVRRAVALKIRLREQARREAAHRESRQDEQDDRRPAVAAAPDADAPEQPADESPERLAEDERIDVDRADAALPVEALIAGLRRTLGLPPVPPAGGPAAAAKAGAGDAGADPKGQAAGPTPHHASANHSIAAEGAGRPGDDDRPSGDTGPPATAPPGDWRQWTDADWAGHRRRETERNARRHPQMPAPIRRHG